MRQEIVVLGDPVLCGQLGCSEIAAVTLRQKDRDESYSIIHYCDTCWQRIRRGYAPLVAHDAAEAVREAEAMFAGDDDSQQQPVC